MPGGFAGEKCGAKTRRGTECQQPSMSNGRCRMHGGKVPKGMDLPQFKTGRYSKAIPDRFAERYEIALTDTERHDLRDEISASEAKVFDLFLNMERGESDSGWLYLRELERQMQRASDDRRPLLLGQILATIQRGADEALAWNDVERWMSRKQRLVETDMKVAKEKREMIAAEEVMAMVTALLDAVRKNVEDDATRIAISEDIRRIAEGRRDGMGVPVHGSNPSHN